jgi:superfamily I DNA and RNA helicase
MLNDVGIQNTMEFLANPLKVILSIQEQLEKLDEEQRPIASQIPSAPQRIRGLAGTGKTILLAKRLAKIHASHPEWKVAFVFFTQSLYEQIYERIYKECLKKTDEEPNWDIIHVLHAWGSVARNGFYRTLALACGKKPMSVGDVERELQHQKRNISPGEAFEYVCNRLEEEVPNIPVLYDAILIDEGQDLPASFYRLAWKTLSEAKRLYWAYDEAQGIGSLMVPTATEIFGLKPDGTLAVDLRGSAKNLNVCYRTPKLLLMAAHAVNMGLFRKQGALQGVTDKKDWANLGYEVVEGDFTDASVKAGKPVKITRPDKFSPHPADLKADLREAAGELLILQTFSNESQEIEWVAGAVASDIKRGLQPDHILITAIKGKGNQSYFERLKAALSSRGVSSYIAGVDGNPDIFRIEGCVTICGIHSAKGNEAYKVYTCKFHNVTRPFVSPDSDSRERDEAELRKRNEAFVALTRSRIWCAVTGLEDPIFDELRTAKQHYPNLIFPAFNQKSLKRVTSEGQG